MFLKSTTVITLQLISSVIGSLDLKRDDHVRWGNVGVLKDYVLRAQVISNSTVAAINDDRDCVFNCLNHFSCFSANLFRGQSSGTSSCELLNTDPFRNATLLAVSSGNKHIFFQGDCSSFPCKNGGSCLTNYSTGSWECWCTPGHVGSTCERFCAEAALGMKDGRIQDNQISISSCDTGNCATHPPHRGRLDIATWPFGAQTDTMVKDPNPWFQVKFVDVTYVTEVALQGYGYVNTVAMTTSFQVSTSLDLVTWKLYKEDTGSVKTFPGNTHPHITVKNRFNKPLKTKAVRLLPKTCNQVCSFRVEIYGCSAK